MKRSKNLFTEIIDALVDNAYVIIPNALDSKLPSELKAFAQNQKNFTQAKISNTSKTHLDSTKRCDKTLWMNEDSDVQSKYLDFANELQNHLNRELYLGINYYESHFSVYDEGDFYERHLDAFKGSKNRIVTTVYYLNEEWNEKDGGELIIYDEEDKIIQKVTPQGNTLVVFLSDKFEHEVLAAKKKRFSIAGWFRINN